MDAILCYWLAVRSLKKNLDFSKFFICLRYSKLFLFRKNIKGGVDTVNEFMIGNIYYFCPSGECLHSTCQSLFNNSFISSESSDEKSW